MREPRRKSRAAVVMLAALTIMLGGSAPQEPPTGTRLDPELAMMMARMEAIRAAGLPGEIPLLARSAGVYEGPPGADESWVEVIIRGDGVRSAVRSTGGRIGSSLGRIHTARVPLSTLGTLAASSGIEWIEAAMVCYPTLDTSVPATGADQLHAPAYGLKGAGVLVAIYDTGVDYTHDDFRNSNGTTRIKAMWDQSVVSGPGSPPSGYSYGREWSEADLNDELDGSPAGTVSQQDISGHGTHVGAIAAGNGRGTGNGIAAGRHVGMAPEADILVIKGGDDSFLSSKVMDGVDWAISTATGLGQPVVINLSLGGHSGAHDGTSNYELYLDSALGSGQVIVVAAGNEGDLGIHSQIALVAGLTDIDSFAVTVDYGTGSVQTGTGNDYMKLDSWYNGTASISVTVRAPDGTTYGPVSQGGSLILDQGAGNVSVNSTLSPVPTNGDHEALIVIDDATVGQEPMPGDWWIIYELVSGSSATVDAWIYESTFGTAVSGGDASYSVGTPGTAADIITVGAYVTKWSWTAIDDGNYSYDWSSDRTGDYSEFSSQGPTRDGRLKPEVSAPGQGIMSALSADIAFTPQIPVQDGDGVHYLSQGTSQAAPHVTGAAALMLQTDATLSAAQIKALLITSADSDAFTGSVPNQTWGNGKLDAKGAVDLVAALDDSIGPSFTLGLLRNSVVTDFLDVFAIPSETLIDTPLVRITPPSASAVTVGTTPIVTSEGTLYAGDYRLTADGSYTLSATGTDIAGNDSTTTRNFSAALVSAAGATMVTANGLLRVTLPSGSLGEEGYVIASEAIDGLDPPVDSGGGLSPAWRISPDGAPLSRRVRLEFTWDPMAPEFADGAIPAVHRWENGQWIPVESYPDAARRMVEASVEKLGIYQLRARDGGGESSLLHGLDQNYPNPFNGTTQIRFTLARSAQVEVTVLNVRGQRVRILVDRFEEAGRHVVSWDGRGADGRRLASGIYLVAMKVEGRIFTRKVLLLQ